MGECMSKTNGKVTGASGKSMGNRHSNEDDSSLEKEKQHPSTQNPQKTYESYVFSNKNGARSAQPNALSGAVDDNIPRQGKQVGSKWDLPTIRPNDGSSQKPRPNEPSLYPQLSSDERSSKQERSEEYGQHSRHNVTNANWFQHQKSLDTTQHSETNTTNVSPSQHHRSNQFGKSRRFDEEDESSSQQRRSNEPGNSRRFQKQNDNSFLGGAQNFSTPAEQEELDLAFIDENFLEKISKGMKFETIATKYPKPSTIKDMSDFQDLNTFFMIKPFKNDPLSMGREPQPINDKTGYQDRWDGNYVRMPCSKSYIGKDNKPMWPIICMWLKVLKQKCDDRSVTFRDLKSTLEGLGGCPNDIISLEKLIENIYSKHEREQFLYTTLSGICDLVLHVQNICTQPPPLLKSGFSGSVTMSQRQAASLLACSFFCLFPDRSQASKSKESERYPNPNFDRLYQKGSTEKIEKIKCIIHYFKRVTEQMPNGVITFQRYGLPRNVYPQWQESKTTLCEMHLTTALKIEDVHNALQVDFANKYIGGGVLGNGCVQEEIRFSICPEMLVSLLVCEVMEKNECVFLIGCERYSSYKGYAQSFKFDGNFDDKTPKDEWGRKWCHLVAIDAIYFRDKTAQYHMKSVERELLKAYTGFRPTQKGPEYQFAIATGNWGCGAFNGDRQLKAIIQLMAASEAGRPLIYAAFGDKNLVNSFADVYNVLIEKQVTVGDLYYWLHEYSKRYNDTQLFDFIFMKLTSQKSQL